MKRFLTTCLLVMGSMAGVLPAGELKNERLFAVNFGENAAWEFGKSTSVEIPGVSALNPQTDIACSGYGTEPAKPLSATAVRLLENTRCGGLSGSFAVMPLGKTDQAVAFAAKGRVPAAAGAVTFWFRGQAWDYTATADKNKDNPKRVRFRKWDVATPLRETFCEFRAAGGAASFGKLVLEAGGARVSAAIDFDVSLVHLLAVNYGDGKAQIHVDGVLKGEGAFTMPADVQEIVVGHVGPGSETWNRWLDDFAVWKRPLKVSEMMLLRQKEGAVQIPLQTTIPKTANAPLIDGLMKEGEWDRAAAVTGMQSLHLGGGYEVYLDGGDLSDLKDRVFLCYDDRNLYVGYHCPPPREIKGDAAMTAAMLKRGISVFDANVDSDDAIQICVQYPKPGGDLYNLFVNGINTHYDFHYGGTVEGSRLPGGCKLAWDPKWRTASRFRRTSSIRTPRSVPSPASWRPTAANWPTRRPSPSPPAERQSMNSKTGRSRS
jgi:hypothetical protein